MFFKTSIKAWVLTFTSCMLCLLSVVQSPAVYGSSVTMENSLKLTPKENEMNLENIRTWQSLKVENERLKESDHSEGLAFMISGAALVIGGTIGYNHASNDVERLIFSISQSFGIGGIGYGAYRYSVGDDARSFVHSVESVGDLRADQRDRLAASYAAYRQANRHDERLIRIITHALVAGLNFYQASNEKAETPRSVMYVLGAANTVAILALTF